MVALQPLLLKFPLVVEVLPEEFLLPPLRVEVLVFFAMMLFLYRLKMLSELFYEKSKFGSEFTGSFGSTSHI